MSPDDLQIPASGIPGTGAVPRRSALASSRAVVGVATAASLWMLQRKKLATVGFHGSLHTHHHYNNYNNYLHDR